MTQVTSQLEAAQNNEANLRGAAKLLGVGTIKEVPAAAKRLMDRVESLQQEVEDLKAQCRARGIDV